MSTSMNSATDAEFPSQPEPSSPSTAEPQINGKPDSFAAQDEAPIAPSTPPHTDSSLSILLQNTVDKTLQFLSAAKPETVAACVVGLSASTYVILGRVGLLLIGAVGGVVLHATWENRVAEANAAKDREPMPMRETGLQIALRVLQWRESRTSSRDLDESDSERTHLDKLGPTDFSEFPPETSRALNVLTNAVIRDYVDYWYGPVRPDDKLFPAISRQTYTRFLLALSANISRKRPADTFLEFVTNSSSIIIVILTELAAALSTSPSSPAKDAVFAYLDLKPQSNLANILDPAQQQKKLQTVANEILETYLDPAVFACPPARVFLREVLANSVLDMTLQNCCRSEWINEWIVYLLEEGEPELLNAIDAGVEGAAQNRNNPKPELASVATTQSLDDSKNVATIDHKRNASRADEETDEAMREAQRLTQLIIEEEAKRTGAKETSNTTSTDYASDSTNTHGIETPASSQSESHPDQPESAAIHEAGDAQSTSSAPQEAQTPLADESPAPDPELPIQLPHYSTSQPEEKAPDSATIAESLTLHKASISIFDDADPNDRRAIKIKPTTDYMVQIEPASSGFPGWMIARTYTDFESLHEVLRRISTISGAVAFVDAHGDLPGWKGKTKSQLASGLERYLIDAVQFEPLAESEGMKRFLEKSRGVSKSPTSKNPFWASQAALENMGRGVFDVISKAPKGVAGGGKAVIGGVTSVLGGGQQSQKKGAASSSVASNTKSSTAGSDSAPYQVYQSGSTHATTSSVGVSQSRTSIDSFRNVDPTSGPSESGRPSSSFEHIPPASPNRPSTSEDKINTPYSAATPPTPSMPQLNLPPRPSDLPDHFQGTTSEVPSEPPLDTPAADVPAHDEVPAAEVSESIAPTDRKPRRAKNNAPLSEQEATITMELLFAVINELYLLSSAWNIRRTLLNAARTYLLRPGNPQLETIRALLQESVLDANASDAGIAAHILKLRENSLPTEAELKTWPVPLNDEEKEALRKKARKLFVERGMPAALMSVMGGYATSEAMGKVFDCLQVEEVAKGLMFGLMLQALRAMTQ